MIVVEKKAVPIYELQCFECGSRIHYKRVDVSGEIINCPVCGVRNMAICLYPVNYVEMETPTQSNDSKALDALEWRGEE